MPHRMIRMTAHKSIVRILLAMLAALLWPLDFAQADIKLWGTKEDKGKLVLAAESLWRYELWDWFTPTGPQDGDYGYFFTRSRSALKWTSPEKLDR